MNKILLFGLLMTGAVQASEQSKPTREELKARLKARVAEQQRQYKLRQAFEVYSKTSGGTNNCLQYDTRTGEAQIKPATGKKS